MAQLSGSEVSKVESDISQTLSVADSVVTLVREPISLLYNNIHKTKKLKQSLAAWRGEVLDANGQSRIPVLRRDEFEDHLVATDGKIEYYKSKSTKTEEDRRAGLGEKFRSYWLPVSNYRVRVRVSLLNFQMPVQPVGVTSYTR
ncbi:hypothetical protein TCE0_017r04189 [Talaromyces pinophilus]|jgi:hypothetical protein|uniref:Uncharacterized protein n=1 Tax=Talaromyces pinophilus TaxID=128442 RepID=A0A6V8H2X9_TALPI|nr:hypothetical protein TCE0_017r04189 [Talaromyces pinophilus]